MYGISIHKTAGFRLSGMGVFRSPPSDITQHVGWHQAILTAATGSPGCQVMATKLRQLCGWLGDGTYGYLWLPMVTYGYLWVPMGTYGYLWVPMGTYGLWMFLDVSGRDNMEKYPKFTGFISQIIMGTSLWMLSNALNALSCFGGGQPCDFGAILVGEWTKHWPTPFQIGG